MTDASKNNSHPDANQPPLMVHGQYIKDLSFENPNPLKSLSAENGAPDINVNFDIKVNDLQNNTYEVALHIKADAKLKTEAVFLIELEYAGVFTLNNVPQDSAHPILMIECPRLLFPSARSIIATISREGGFPALSLHPIDFVQLYRQQFVKDDTNPTLPETTVS